MLERLRYVRLPSANLPAAVAFARDIVGLEVVETTSEMAQFRSDERAYTLEYNAAAGAATGPVLAIEVRTSSVLDEIQRGFAERGLQVVRLDLRPAGFGGYMMASPAAIIPAIKWKLLYVRITRDAGRFLLGTQELLLFRVLL